MSQKNKDIEKPNTGPPDQYPKSQKFTWISLAIVGSLVSFFLSWPWWRDYSNWAESRTMWAIYFVVGFILAVYVFYAFFGSMRTLFEHDAIEREEAAEESDADDSENRS